MAIELSDWVVALRLAQRRVADEIQAANTHLNRASRLMDIETKGGEATRERERESRLAGKFGPAAHVLLLVALG